MPDHTFPDNPAAIDYRVVAALSLLLSLWLIAIDPVLNRDAILYLRTADAYLQGGFAASQQLFERPALSICLALLHQFTGLPLVYARQDRGSAVVFMPAETLEALLQAHTSAEE